MNNKINLNYDNLPKDDRRFSELMEKEAVKIDEHYKLALPMKDKELVLLITGRLKWSVCSH